MAQCMNFHFRPEEAARPGQAQTILMSVLRLCFKTKTMIWPGDFNKSRDQMMEIVANFQKPEWAHFLRVHDVEYATLHYHDTSPEIMLVLIKHEGLEGWAWEPSPGLDWVRAEELGMHTQESDAHRPLVGHLVSTTETTRFNHDATIGRKKHQRSEHAQQQRREKKKEKNREKTKSSSQQPERSQDWKRDRAWWSAHVDSSQSTHADSTW